MATKELVKKVFMPQVIMIIVAIAMFIIAGTLAKTPERKIAVIPAFIVTTIYFALATTSISRSIVFVFSSIPAFAAAIFILFAPNPASFAILGTSVTAIIFSTMFILAIVKKNTAFKKQKELIFASYLMEFGAIFLIFQFITMAIS